MRTGTRSFTAAHSTRRPSSRFSTCTGRIPCARPFWKHKGSSSSSASKLQETGSIVAPIRRKKDCPGEIMRNICHYQLAHLSMLQSKKKKCHCLEVYPGILTAIFPMSEENSPQHNFNRVIVYALSLYTKNSYSAGNPSETHTMPVLFRRNKTGMLVSYKKYAMFDLQHPYPMFHAARRSPAALGERPLHIAQTPRAQRPPLVGESSIRGPATSSKRRNSQHNLDLSNPGAEHGKIAMV